MNANCLKCVAICTAHKLHCEADIMKGRDTIDCKTFRPQTTNGEKERDKQEILTVMRGVRKNLKNLRTETVGEGE